MTSRNQGTFSREEERGPWERGCLKDRHLINYQVGLLQKSGFVSGVLETYKNFRDLEGFLGILDNIFKVFCLFVTKSLKLGKVSSQAILKFTAVKRKKLHHIRSYRALKFESVQKFTRAKFLRKRCITCPGKPNFTPAKLVHESYFIFNPYSTQKYCFQKR